MSEGSIVQTIKSYLASDTLAVPVFNAVAVQLQQVLARPDFHIDHVHQLISSDSGLASQVLRVANSSFYSGLSSVTTVHDAIVRLGSREVANIAMLASQQDLYKSDNPHFSGVMENLWLHSFCCAVGSKWLAGKAGMEELIQEAFLAGLLHDIGKLFLLKVMEQISTEGELGKALTPAIMGEVLDSLHVEQGHLLMQKWHMPEIYCEVARWHEAEQWPHTNPLLAVVRLANMTCHKLGIGLVSEPALLLFATTEAQILGVREIVLAELEIVLEDTVKRPMPIPS